MFATMPSTTGINKAGFRNLLESRCNGDHREFGRQVTHLLGLTDARGRYHTDRLGRRVLRDPADQARIPISDISTRGLLEATVGEGVNPKIIGQYLNNRELFETSTGGEAATWTRSLFEDSGAGAVMASAFANINAYTGVVSGLLEVAILEAYENPEFIGDVLAPAEPSKQFEGRKTIGVSRLGNQAEERLPGMPTKRVGAIDRWITQPRTVEKALACEVTQEAMFLDITGGQLAEHCGAAGVGEWLAYAKELDCVDAFIGVTNSFNYRGTSYTTYVASGALYDNYISSGNELLHEDNVQAPLIKFRDMTDPETGTRILIRPNTVLVNREKIRLANGIFGPNAIGYQLRDVPTAGAGVTQQINVSEPAYKGQFKVLESPLVYQRCTDSTGLNLSATNAGKAWWMFESGPKTLVWVQNWPLRTQTAAPNNADMIDRGVVMFVKADLRGVAMWKDPRRSVHSRA